MSPRTINYYGNEEEEEPSPFIYKPCMTFPDEVEKETDIEHTLAIIKPEAMIYRRQIEERIYEEGFEIRQTRWLQLTPEQASDFYSDNYGQVWFAHLVAYMSSASIIVLVLTKHQAVHDWRFIMGPMKVITTIVCIFISISYLYSLFVSSLFFFFFCTAYLFLYFLYSCFSSFSNIQFLISIISKKFLFLYFINSVNFPNIYKFIYLFSHTSSISNNFVNNVFPIYHLKFL